MGNTLCVLTALQTRVFALPQFHYPFFPSFCFLLDVFFSCDCNFILAKHSLHLSLFLLHFLSSLLFFLPIFCPHCLLTRVQYFSSHFRSFLSTVFPLLATRLPSVFFPAHPRLLSTSSLTSTLLHPTPPLSFFPPPPNHLH